MKKITLFYLENCPYCRNAKQALAELIKEAPQYGQVEIHWVEESKEPDLAGQYDYYYVPTVFMGGAKLYEASPMEPYAACKANLKAALDTALAEA